MTPVEIFIESRKEPIVVKAGTVTTIQTDAFITTVHGREVGGQLQSKALEGAGLEHLNLGLGHQYIYTNVPKVRFEGT